MRCGKWLLNVVVLIVPWRNLKRFLSKVLRQPGYATRVFVKRTAAYLSYYSGTGKSTYPEAITLFLTHRCNLRCKMCGQWGESGVTKKKSADDIRGELTLDEMKGLIDDVFPFRPSITLFGGEPLLHGGCVDLIRHIKEKKMHCLMITNGSLLVNYAADVVDAGLDELNVSLDGGGELHDEIRGMPGVFEKVTNGLKEVSRLKKERGTARPLVNLQCTISKYNYRHLEQLTDVAEEIAADSLTYHNLIFLTQDSIEKQKAHDKALGFSSREWEGFVFEPGIDPDDLYSKITDILSAGYTFGVDFYPNFSIKGLREYYNNPSYLPSEYAARCLSPWVVAYIFPDGEIRPCLNFSYSYGNIKETKFSELWNNEKAVRFRRNLKENRIFPVCVRCTELYRY